MSAKNRGVSDKAYSLPANPSWLVFERSDGDESLWPDVSRTRPDIDSDGHVNFLRPVAPDEASSIRWRHGVALAVARQLDLPVGPNYVLKSFPEGYRMYDHHKGPHEEPRRDLYLYGSKNARFRSVNEFVPHAFWLLRDQTGNPVCQCKYCSKRPQREISFTMGLSQSPAPVRIKPGGLPPTKSLGHTTGRPRDRRLRDQIHKPYAAVHRVPKPSKEPSGPKQKMLRERNNDLRATLSDTGVKGKRWFRESELLWCKLDAPIHGRNGEEDSISFWPGLVQEIVLKIKSMPLTAAASGDDKGAQNGTAVNTGSSRPVAVASGRNPTDDSNPPLWNVDQSFVYKIKLLALEYTTTLPAERLLPYQAYSMSSGLFNAIREFPLDSMDMALDTMSTFDLQATMDNPDRGYKRFEEAVVPYTLAIQIASAVAGYWCPTDEWEFKFSVPPTSTGRPEPGPSSLSSVIISASHNNAMNTSSMSSEPGKSTSSAGPDNASLRLLGQSPLPKPFTQLVTQVRFQGLWWGGERIWTDDIVRLKMSRLQLAPNGAVDIYPPSGPSRQTVEYHLASEHPPENPESSEFGAAGRGMFMRLEGLFVVNVPREDGTGTRKECRACGMLYELADEGWEEPVIVQAEDASVMIGDAASSSQQATTGTDENGTTAGPPSTNGTLLPPLQATGVSPIHGASHPKSVQPSTLESTVPVTVSRIIHSDNKTLSPNSQLSHPILSVPAQLPSAPKGFKFRPILATGCEAVVSLSLVAGRYYPLLLSHPLLRSSVEMAIQNTQEGGLLGENHLWSLEGLSPGFFNSVDPVKMKTSRAAMLRDAHVAAQQVMELAREQRIQLKAEKLKTERQDETEGFLVMDVDTDI